LLDPTKQGHNQSRPDGQLKLTASAFNRLWISMPAVLVIVPTVMQNWLHPLSTSSITACQLLDFMVQGKITEADAPTIRVDYGCQIPRILQIPHFSPSPASWKEAAGETKSPIFH